MFEDSPTAREKLVKFILDNQVGAFSVNDLMKVTDAVSPGFLAKVTVYTGENSKASYLSPTMLAILSKKSSKLLSSIFSKVCSDFNRLRTFVRVIRSGITGRRSLGTTPKKLIQVWLNSASYPKLLVASISGSPSLAEIIGLSHPKPEDNMRRSFYGYVLGREIDQTALPDIVKQFILYKQGRSKIIQGFSSLDLVSAIDRLSLHL